MPRREAGTPSVAGPQRATFSNVASAGPKRQGPAMNNNPANVHAPTAVSGPQGAWGDSEKVKSMMSRPSVAGSRYAPQRGPGGPSLAPASALTGQMGRMSLNPQASCYNPSMAPSPSMIGFESLQAWLMRGKTLYGSKYSIKEPIYNQVARITNYSRATFRRGEIIGVPFHQPNLNPKVALPDPAWTLTNIGPVYSKRRMVIVLFIYKRDMFCLPMYTHNMTGLEKKQGVIEEYICCKDKGNTQHVNAGMYPPLEVDHSKKPMHAQSTCHITGGLTVSCNDDITPIGRLTKASYDELIIHWRALNDGALQEPWRES